MFTSESPTVPSAVSGHLGTCSASSTRAANYPRVRQLCPAGVTPGAPWRNGVVPLAAYVIYTPTHALAASSSSFSAFR